MGSYNANDDSLETNPTLFPASIDTVSQRVSNLVEIETKFALDEFRNLLPNASLDRFLQTVWSIVLHRFSGSSPLLFACSAPEHYQSSRKPVPQSEMYVCKVFLDEETSVGNLVTDGGSIVRCSVDTVGRDLYNSSVLIQHGFGLTRDKSSLDSDPITPILKTREEFDVALIAVVHKTTVQLLVHHQLSHTSEVQARNLTSNVEQVVQSMIKGPLHQKVIEMDMFSDRNRADITSWYNPHLGRRAFVSVAEQIHRRSVEDPCSPAVVSWDGTVSYGELERLSSNVAKNLISRGVGPGSFVGLCFEKSKWAIVALVAIHKTGAAFVPLDLSYPLRRMEAIMRQVRATFILTSASSRDKLAQTVEQVIIVDESLALSQPDVPFPEIAPTDPAYVLFTSGSTGAPKGCVMDQDAFSTVDIHGETLKIDRGRRVLQFASLSFGVSLIEIWCTLVKGGTVCVPSDESRLNGLTDVMETLQVSWAILTPSLASTIDPTKLSKLEILALAGELAGKSQAASWLNSRVHVMQAHGLTEWCGICCVNPQVRSVDTLRTIGRPSNANVWVADPEDYQRPAPVGAAGELLLQGPSLAQGYFDNPSVTEMAFKSTPEWVRQISGQRGRVYRTGDLVQYNPDGTLQYVGRKGVQVKIRGQRVELGEVEYQVKQCFPTKVSKVIAEVVTLQGKPYPHLLAFIVPERPLTERQRKGSSLFEEPSDNFLHHAKQADSNLRNILPPYMLPESFIPLSDVPLTVSGKTDRRTLRECASSLDMAVFDFNRFLQSNSKQSSTKPKTSIESQLQQIFAQVLKAEESTVGIDDNFFHLGGDSIAAMQVVSKCRHAGISLTVQDIFHCMTVSSLAAKLGPIEPDPLPSNGKVDLGQPQWEHMVDPSSLPVPLDKVDTAFSCSPMQQGMLLSRARETGSYQVRTVWKLKTRSSVEVIQLDRLKMAWQAVVKRHPMLRAIVVENSSDNGCYFYNVVLKETPSINVVQQDGSEITISRIIKNQWRDYKETEPQVQLTLFVQSSMDTIFCLLDTDHTLLDAGSMRIIMRDLVSAYCKTLQPGPCYSFQKYTQYLKTISQQPSLAYWKEYLKAAEPCLFPALEGEPARLNKGKQLKMQNIVFEDAQMKTLHSFCQSTGTTLSNILQVAWGVVLCAYTGFSNVCFGSLTAGRDVPVTDIDEAVGPFITMLITRVDLTQDNRPVKQILQQNRQDFVQGLSYQHCSLADILHSSQLGDQPLFNTVFSFRRPLSPEESDMSPFTVECTWEQSPTEYDISINAITSGSRMTVFLEYWTTILSDYHAANVLDTYSRAISEIISKPHATVADLNLCTERTKQQLSIWNWPVYEVDMCMDELIRTKCASRPNSTALCAWDGSLTYSELYRLSSALADHLVETGIKPEMYVGLCFEKSKWATVAMVAVVLAGGAFVMLDPSHPQLRLKEIVRDAGAAWILSSTAQSPLSQSLTTSSSSCVIVCGETLDQLLLPGSRVSSGSSSRSSGVSVQPHNALYAVYTSGSTGKPKGVVIDHRMFVTGSRARQGALSLTDTARVFQFSSYSFDVSISDTLLCLATGACLCVPSETERINHLAETINTYQADWACLTPSVLRMLHPKAVPTLQTIIVGGEPLSNADIAIWSGQSRLIAEYGPAECSVGCCVQSQINKDSDPSNIGFAMGCKLWIVDKANHEKLAPIGAAGELVVQGPIVGRGYLNNPAQTAEVFITKPPQWLKDLQSSASASRLYKTGDIARYSADGSIKYIGRKDTQVKLRGQRIELGDIEQHVRACFERARHVCVDIITPKQATAAMVIAFVELNDVLPNKGEKNGDIDTIFLSPDAEFRSEAIRVKSCLTNSLPTFMIPSTFIPVRRLPLTFSGKLDRLRLQKSVKQLPFSTLMNYISNQREIQLPATPAQQSLQELVASVLGVSLDIVSMANNFLGLGGDSSTAMKLVSAARQARLFFTVRDVFLCPNLESLAHKGSHHDSSQTPKTHERATIDEAYLREIIGPQVFGGADNIAEIMHTTDFQTESILYWPCTHFFLSMKGAVDSERLKAACQALLDRHSALRTVFVSHQHALLQIVLGHIDLDFTQILCSEDLTSAAEDLCRADNIIPLPLSISPLRFKLLSSLHGQEHVLIIRMSHAQYDGYSMSTIYQDLATAYQRDTLSNPSSGFSTYVRHIQCYNTDTSFAIWREILKDASMTHIPQSTNTTIPCTHRSDEIIESQDTIPSFDLPTGVTMATLFKAASAYVFMQLTSQQDVTFGQVVNGRGVDLPGVEGIVGPCLNIIPVRVQAGPTQTVAQFLRQIHDQHVQTMICDTVGLSNIIRQATSWPEDTQLGMLFQHQNIDLTPQFSLDHGIDCTARAFSQPYQRSYLHVVTVPRNDSIFVYVSSPAGLMSQQRLQKVLEGLVKTVQCFAAQPGQAIADCKDLGLHALNGYQ
ncbi:uncharacterized protein BDW43DRAFT_280203 [Aspergillus alliaceus]|uniref:uncharacterized protein n=1 Tax=Petromyces alliaceus TaxID=209559 RepID=UPI0012A6C94B|nr:uncharacterized protein BDW43DRAFT_280203 [Aspergillus alliaceus]KAB8232044.1 hypothetical protein BDW43DRAFT_280203 [Aspergillus alliaceus]